MIEIRTPGCTRKALNLLEVQSSNWRNASIRPITELVAGLHKDLKSWRIQACIAFQVFRKIAEQTGLHHSSSSRKRLT